MPFKYARDTREAYTDPHVALEYDRAFTGKLGWSSLRFKVIAGLERRAIARLLKHTPHGVILDMPCGTGKLATVLGKRKDPIIAADISADMMALARTAYHQVGVPNLTFILGEVESMASWLTGHTVTTTVCLRLMHRVPRAVRLKMLAEISKASRYAVISFAIDNRYHRLRRRFRSFAFKAAQQDICVTTMREIKVDLSTHFELQKIIWIGRLLSEEIVVLARAKASV
jgi:SAM-dependent methyltransferase